MVGMAWLCPACGHDNDGSLVCDACGVARRFFEDPPLDIPRPPRWGEIGAVYLATTYGLLAAGGVVVLTAPGLREAVGLEPAWLYLEVALAGAAGYGSLVHAVWERRFNEATLDAPSTVRTGRPFEATLRLVPYETLERATVTLELVERYVVMVVRNGRRQMQTRTRVLERAQMLSGEAMQGRREHRFIGTFTAPLPSTAHSNVHAEIMASVAGFFAPVVPGLGHTARNLRQHGGYYVRARVRSGLWRRSYERQVVSVAVSGDHW
jgi:hypothetical protein